MRTLYSELSRVKHDLESSSAEGGAAGVVAFVTLIHSTTDRWEPCAQNQQ